MGQVRNDHRQIMMFARTKVIVFIW